MRRRQMSMAGGINIQEDQLVGAGDHDQDRPDRDADQRAEHGRLRRGPGAERGRAKHRQRSEHYPEGVLGIGRLGHEDGQRDSRATAKALSEPDRVVDGLLGDHPFRPLGLLYHQSGGVGDAFDPAAEESGRMGPVLVPDPEVADRDRRGGKGAGARRSG